MLSGGRRKHLKTCVLLIENVDLTVTTPRPCHDLILITLKHNDGRVSKGGAADSCVWIVGNVVEVTKHDVIREDVRHRAGVLGDATWYVGDWTRMLELIPRAV